MTFLLLRSPLYRRRGVLGLLLILAGESLIVIRHRPVSDFDFPLLWFGYILFLDAAVEQQQTAYSLFASERRHFFVLLPISAAVWWLFELFDQVVHNWVYIGDRYTGLALVGISSLDFSTVLPAVWTTALCVQALLPARWGRSSLRPAQPVSSRILIAMEIAGILCIVLPMLFPQYAYGLIWGSMYFVLDPINYKLGRPSIIAAVMRRDFRLPVIFGFAALCCGFFWESWNYWSMPKWVYHIPYLGFWHIFEMPLLGWLGYLPFGLELFAMTNFCLAVLKLSPLTLPGGEETTHVQGRAAQ